jgi:hypothetical protein
LEKIIGLYRDLLVVKAKPAIPVGRLTIGRGLRSGSGDGDKVPAVGRVAEVEHNSHQGPYQEGHCLVILVKLKKLRYRNTAHILAVAEGGAKAAKAHAHNGATVRVWQTECFFRVTDAIRIGTIARTICFRASLVSTLVVASIVGESFNMRKVGVQQVLQN